MDVFYLVKPLYWEPEKCLQSSADGLFYDWFELPENQWEYQLEAD